MRKRKLEAILWTRRYKVHSEPEKYYHSKLLLYYPWCNKEEIISGFDTYQNLYIAKQETVHENSQHFNDDCEIFDLSEQDVDNNLPQSTWDLTAPCIAQEDGLTLNQGFTTIPNLNEEKLPDTDIVLDSNNTQKHHDVLLKLYSKAANREYMNFTKNCKHIRSLNTEQNTLLCSTDNGAKIMSMQCDKIKELMDIEYFSVGQEEQGRAMLWNSFQETCLIFYVLL